MMRLAWQSAAALLAILFLSSTVLGQTRVNVAHLAPFATDVTDTAVSVNANGTQIIDSLVYNATSGYLQVADSGIAPGQTMIDVFAPPAAATAAITATVDLQADTDYTGVAIGDGTNQPLGLLALVDDNSTPTAGNVRLRVVHSAPFASDLAATAVSVRLDDGTVVNGLNSVQFGQESGYFELPVGTYDLQIATPDGTQTLINPAPVTLNDGTVVTLFAVGNGTNQPLGITAVFGDGSAAVLALETPDTEPPAAIPTLSEFAMLLLIGSLIAIGLWRRQKSNPT